MRQYSESRVGKVGEPIAVTARVPFSLMERTMSPRVSQCALRAVVCVDAVPGTRMSRLPFRFLVQV